MGLDREPSPDGHAVVGRYALYDKIAAGGMATVHFGRLLGPIGFSRTVAIKRMLPQFVSDPGFVSMFVDEARLASRIRHPNVIPTLDVVAQENELFLVLDYVHGETLSQLIKTLHAEQKRIPPAYAAAIVCGMLHGLHAAHNVKNARGELLGLVHRDVSPQNVLVGTDGMARLLDFGVAKAAGRLQVTINGQVKGKLAYMAPEQVRGAVTAQSDVYAAAAVLWEALTCERLFQNTTWTNVAQVILQRQVEPPSSVVSDLPPGLDAVVMRGLEKDPKKRFASAREMALAIEDCVQLAAMYEVGEWVERTAKTMLAERAQKLAEIEGRASESRLAAVSMPLVEPATRATAVEPATSDLATRPDAAIPVNTHSSQVTMKEEATDNSPGTPLTQISSNDIVATGSSKALVRWMGLSAGVACAAVISVVLLRQRPQLAPIGNEAIAELGAANQPAPAPTVPPPILSVEPVSDIPSATTTPVVEAPASSAPSASKKGAKRGAGASSKKPDCNPPYVVDENHVRRMKPQCL
ncbi:MAG TPA: serine/threonine-protein kinase [Polyangiaceae bacterium]|nr:serine/threonine-protein kinase [Polyangiaceae bacterium]